MERLETQTIEETPKLTKFEIMDQVHSMYYDKFVKLCQSEELEPDIQKMIEEFVIGRIGSKKGVRAFVCNEMFKVAGGDADNIDISYLLAAIELQLAAGYCYNVAADTKGGYVTQTKKNLAFKTHSIVEELAVSGIDNLNISEEKKDKIKALFDSTWQTFYEAEVIDTILNLFKNRGKLPSEIAVEIENFDGDTKNTYGLEKQKIVDVINNLPDKPIEDYTLERTYKLNAVQLENVGNILGIILELDEDKTRYLSEYGKNYGIEMMIVNDVQDYSLDLIDDGQQKATREKNKSDVFSDLRKGKITWPIKYSIELDPESENLIKKHIGQEDISDDECEEIRKRLIDNGALARCVEEAVRYEKRANIAIRNFNDSESKDRLQETSAELRLSKYVYSLEKKYGVKLQPTKVQRKKMSAER